MLPFLAKIGPVLIPTHFVTWNLAYIAWILFTVWYARSFGIDLNQLINLIIFTILVSFVGARLSWFVMVTGPKEFDFILRHPIELLKVWKGGLSFYGIVGFFIPLGAWYCLRYRVPILTMFDIYIPGVVLGIFIQNWGCLLAGCHYGKPTDLPWGVSYHHYLFPGPRGVSLHPFPVYVSLIGMFIFLFSLGWYQARENRGGALGRIFSPVFRLLRLRFIEGELVCVAGALYSGLRFFAEFTRNPANQIWPPGSPLPQSQYACLGFFCFCLAGYWLYRETREDYEKGIPLRSWRKAAFGFYRLLEWSSLNLPWPVRRKEGG